MPIAFHRFVTGALLVVLTTGCANEQAATPRPVEERSATTLTTTTQPAPPVTKPLVTAPPSPLLDDVVAAYDAAYADLREALFAMDPNHPNLGRHIGGAQLDKWRELIDGYRAEGLRAESSGVAPWRRVEVFTQLPDGAVELEVCRMDGIDGVRADGVVELVSSRPFRYVETIEVLDGSWKWSARELVESSEDSSDCALPS